MDNLSAEDRSRNMAAIRSKNTKPELLVRSLLHRTGLRFVLHDARFPGKPDLVFPKYRTAVFIHGCFWHGHKRCLRYKKYGVPKTNRKYWSKKIETNVKRDAKVIRAIRNRGWRVLTFWECRISDSSVSALSKVIRNSSR